MATPDDQELWQRMSRRLFLRRSLGLSAGLAIAGTGLAGLLLPRSSPTAAATGCCLGAAGLTTSPKLSPDQGRSGLAQTRGLDDFMVFDRPSKGYISTGFGESNEGAAFHKGVDFADAEGTPLCATRPGVVEAAGWQYPGEPNRGYGQWVRLRLDTGHLAIYGHTSEIAVKEGDLVKRGQVIGYMGTTGFSTGTHLHYEMHDKDDNLVDPLIWVPSEVPDKIYFEFRQPG